MPLTRSLAALAAAATLVVPVAAPVAAEPNAGAYLAARHAAAFSDFSAAAEYYAQALARDPENAALIEGLVAATVARNDLPRAVAAAHRLRTLTPENQSANLVLTAEAAKSGEWSTVLTGFEEGGSVGPLFDGLVEAWAHVGAGEMSAALEAFDAVGQATGVQSFAQRHKALAMAQAGDYEGAAEILSGEASGTLNLTRRNVVAYAQILSQIDRNDDAVALVDEVFGDNLDPALRTLRERLASGDRIAFDAVPDAQAGVAEVYYAIGGALRSEAAPAYTLLYARLAAYLRPGHVDAILLSAAILEGMENYELATSAYESVPEGDASFLAAELGRADALRAAGDPEAGIAVLETLAERNGDLMAAQVALADALRQSERFEEAATVYDRAIELAGTPQESDWFVYFARGIAHERSDQWAAAEADFREALALSPGQPQVQNYLGYSLVEQRDKLDEALGLIEEAVEAAPDSGHIIDSLGWALYRLGRFDEAVAPMERAVELMPVDAVVNDHLGDVYWAVGRAREARFQWERALSLATSDIAQSTDDVDPDRIRRKLEVGLDEVIAEEGGAPRRAANDGG